MIFPEKVYLIKKLYSYIWPKDWGIRSRLIGAIILLLMTILLNIGVPLVFRETINAISKVESPIFIAEVLLIAYGVLWTLSKALDQVRLIIFNRVVERGVRLLSLNLFDHLNHLSLDFHTKRKTGVIVSIIDRVKNSFAMLVWAVLFLIVPTIIEVIIATAILIYLFGILYGIILATILLTYMIFTVKGSRWSVGAQKIANEKSSLAANKIVDSLLNYETIRYFTNQRYEHARCDQILAEQENTATKQHLYGEVVLLGQGIIMGIGLIILTYLSGMSVTKGVLLVSDFVLINGYLLQFMVPLSHFGYVLRDMNEGFTNLAEMLKILDEKPTVQDKVDAKSLNIKTSTIQFDHVNFSYDIRRPILQNITFEISSGKVCAIVGATGSGKSTIAKLLFRYYDVSSGAVLIDGQDIRDVTQLSLQQNIGVVPQHTTLFNDTLYYNIAYGSPNASESEIQIAIQQAHLEKFIQSLPDGLNTVVGEHGLKLSGGERQRVAIARVLLKKPIIYVFDEATSSLDTHTERLIQQNIQEISQNGTTLIIAHRLSTIVHADQILVLDNGKLVERGTHGELLKNNGIYAKLWEKQIHESGKTE